MAWESLLGFEQEAADWVRNKFSEPPTQCPYDLTPLTAGPGGESQLYCPWAGDYHWPRDGRVEL